MGEKHVIPKEARAKVGKESPQRVLGEITKRDIRRFAQAVGDLNPLYFDDDYAKNSRFGGIIAPLLFYFSFVYDPGPEAVAGDDGTLREPSGVERYGGIEYPQLPLKNILAGGRELEFLQMLRPGDILSVTGKILDLYEKEGKRGKLVFVVSENTYFNQNNEVVLKEKITNIFY